MKFARYFLSIGADGGGFLFQEHILEEIHRLIDHHDKSAVPTLGTGKFRDTVNCLILERNSNMMC